MQYGVNVKTYNRVYKKREINLRFVLSNIVTIIFIGLMLGRVDLRLISDISIAPFGIAYLLSVGFKKEFKKSIGAFCGISLGYLSIYMFHKEFFIYFFGAVAILLFSGVVKKNNIRVKKQTVFLLEAIVILFASILLKEGSLIGAGLFSGIRVVSIILTFYIINYGVQCAEELNTDYLFSTEELISIAILLCLIIAGVGSISIANIALINILALTVVILVAFSGGVSTGAIIGITMGLIVGISNDSLITSLALYSACGLVVGVFKEIGKFASVIAYVVIYSIIIMYTANIGVNNVIELIVSALFFWGLPIGFMKSLLVEINNDEKLKSINAIQLDGVKAEFVERLDNLQNVFSTMSISLKNLSENDKLLLKGKGTAMVESLADRVCANCEMNRKCWDRELLNTFSDFSELIKSYELKNPIFPKELDGKCVKKTTLIRNTEELINTYIVNDAMKKRLIEGRKLIATQINNVSMAIKGIITDFNNDIASCLEIDKSLRKNFVKNKIRFNSVYTYADKKGRLKIKIKLDNIDGSNYCSKYIVPIISDVVKVPLAIAEDEIMIDPITNECLVVVEEAQKYHVVSYAACAAKDGENYSGDSFSFGKNKEGIYITAISDGMGSGPEAGVESGAAIELMEKFMAAGFTAGTSLNVVNTIMGMKFTEEEKFTTLDMNAIDLYTGDISFIKVGGVSSFIKKSNTVDIVDSSTLPFGILDTIDVDVIKKTISHGDIIITVSDGILDVDKNNVLNDLWIYDFLEKGSKNPEQLSREILKKAKELSGGKVKDDMTVVVSKVYSVF